MPDDLIKGNERQIGAGGVIKDARQEESKPRTRVDDLWEDESLAEEKAKKVLAGKTGAGKKSGFTEIRYPAWVTKYGRKLQIAIVTGIEVGLLAALVLTALYFAVFYLFAQFDIFSAVSWRRLQLFYRNGGAIPAGFIACFIAAGLIFGYGVFRVIQNNRTNYNQYAEIIFKPLLMPFKFIINAIVTVLNNIVRGFKGLLYPMKATNLGSRGRKSKKLKKRRGTPKSSGLEDDPPAAEGTAGAGGGNTHEHSHLEPGLAAQSAMKSRDPHEH